METGVVVVEDVDERRRLEGALRVRKAGERERLPVGLVGIDGLASVERLVEHGAVPVTPQGARPDVEPATLDKGPEQRVRRWRARFVVPGKEAPGPREPRPNAP